jgi:hypothetical protein
MFVSRIRAHRSATLFPGWLAFLLVVALICTFSYEADFLSSCFAQVCLVLIAVQCIDPPVPAQRGGSSAQFLMMVSGLGAILFASFTYYFSPHRSWLSGILALPFSFGVGLTLLVELRQRRPSIVSALVTSSLALAVACVVSHHYRSIFRDAQSADLSARFSVPKLKHIRSTEERVRAVDALYAYIQPRISRGETLLVFDECPMLYFIFDSVSAYGFAGARRYNLNVETLRRLNDEMNAKSLPAYAIRTLVDVSNPVWRTAPRTNYQDYPLNETVITHYDLEKTIFPFEIWQRKSDSTSIAGER